MLGPLEGAMEVSREFIRTFTFITGPLVLISYAYALSRLEDWDSLWGGIPKTWITYIVPFMFLAAIGFLMFWWVALFQIGENLMVMAVSGYYSHTLYS